MSSSHRAFRVIKNEIRVLGVDDGKFIPHTRGNVIVVGIVFRGGSSIDGIMHTEIAIDGLDATDKLAQMIMSSPHCHQLRLVMLNGVTFAGFNLVDIQKLHLVTGLPVLAVTQEKPDLDAIHDALKHLPDTEVRWRIVKNAGELFEVTNRGAKLYVEFRGLTLEEVKTILELTSTRSSLPEPLRVAHLVASGISS